MGILLGASYASYAAFGARGVAALLSVTIVGFAGALWLEESRSKWSLTLVVGMLLVPLLFYKFGHTIQGELRGRGGYSANVLFQATVIPVGLSFYTFQAISYVIDVHRGILVAVRSLPLFGTYLGFFPLQLAGPIERAGQLLPQLAAPRWLRAADVFIGLKVMLWGFFCKLVVADRIGGVVDELLGRADEISKVSLFSALCLFSFRLYFDFYGYTNIAIGSARAFGIVLTPNFAHPFLSRSLREFWRRWHITLMTWFRDYLYRPLGGPNSGVLRYAVAILTVFVVSGVWHGAEFGFVLWGIIHGALYLGGVATRSSRERLAAIVGLTRMPRARAVSQVLCCFALISLAWLPFAVPDGSELWSIISGNKAPLGVFEPVLTRPDTLIYYLLVGAAFAIDSLGWVRPILTTVPAGGRQLAGELALVNAMGVSLFLLGGLGTQDFIYFQF